AEFFRASVLKVLLKEGWIDNSFIKMIMTWRHNSGFSVHNEVRIQPGDSKGIENTGTVIYRSKMSHGGNKKNFQTFSALEFMAAITQHIPDRLAQMVRYLGWYSNRMRGDRRKAEEVGANCEEKKADQSEVIVVSGFDQEAGFFRVA
ncbi:MAG: transposase, partial [Desulfobacterales bacterium]|nr:transposase [Desulfobacterales bacterium]MDX2511468.1 transposase [Desulfobacterales bacterium]